MATNLPIRTLRRVTDSAIRKKPIPKRTSFAPTRPLWNTPRFQAEADTDPANRPRWQSTPPAMVAPVSTNFREEQNRFPVNKDPKRLDRVYQRLLGEGGGDMLPEEVKWLAVTHKSFDHGRRGFNDRLAWFGKRVVDLQTSLALLNAPKPQSEVDQIPEPDNFGRTLFQHRSLENLEQLTESAKAETLDKSRLAQLANSYGLPQVIRWKPKNTQNLAGSGIETVLAHTMYAIVGAVTLQNGGEVGNRFVKEKVLAPLGL
ncbi:MAG: hypothetical protein M1820_001538 [Bogoriella megaspora]|nr:MAG: hypothetical protein M1820_001538 [Bogoriella megaspora]